MGAHLFATSKISGKTRKVQRKTQTCRLERSGRVWICGAVFEFIHERRIFLQGLPCGERSLSFFRLGKSQEPKASSA